MSIKKNILKLKQSDIYTLMLFVLFRVRELPEYSTLSEMAYILDKDSLLKLCEYFGGMTIQIPTINELQSILYSLTLYQYINVENIPYELAIEKIGQPAGLNIKQIKADYIKICDIMKDVSISE